MAHDVCRFNEPHMMLLTVFPNISQVVACDRAATKANVLYRCFLRPGFPRGLSQLELLVSDIALRNHFQFERLPLADVTLHQLLVLAERNQIRVAFSAYDDMILSSCVGM